MSIAIAFSGLLFILLFHVSVEEIPSPEQMRRMMMADWKNTEKYRPSGTTRREQDYLRLCGERISNNYYSDDDYYHYNEGRGPYFRAKAGEGATRCKHKELRMMSRDELVAWANAFRAWNKAVVDTALGRTEQEVFVINHRYPRAEPAHYGPCFLCWHQIYLQLYEAALQKYNASVCPPYWDSRLDQCLTDPHDSVLWSKDLMGTRHGPVVEGLFANLTIHPADCKQNSTQPYIYREVVRGGDGRYYLYSDPIQDDIFSKALNNYTQLCYPKYPDFEDRHGYGHMWIAGSMAPLSCSPNEPMFFCHHENVNRLFKVYIRDHLMGTDRKTYYPDWPDVPTPQKYNGTLSPFQEVYSGITCGSGLNSEYDLWSMYEEPPVNCNKSSDCGSEMLWCKPNCNGKRRCSAKIMEGGKCDGYPLEACYQPQECLKKNKTMSCTNLGSGNVCNCS